MKESTTKAVEGVKDRRVPTSVKMAKKAATILQLNVILSTIDNHAFFLTRTLISFLSERNGNRSMTSLKLVIQSSRTRISREEFNGVSVK